MTTTTLRCSWQRETWTILLLLLLSSRIQAFQVTSGSSRHWTSSSFQQPFRLHANTSNKNKNAQEDISTSIWSQDQVLSYASQQGVLLSLSSLGPGYRVVARAKHNETQILGYCEGFLRPGGQVLHLDKMQVFRKMVLQAREENPMEFKRGGTVFGIGLLLGYLCLLHGRDNGYTVGEFLAIDDEETQHRKLVKYYERSGFKIIKYVGDDFMDIPDRLVWGGCGTLMRETIDTLLVQWTTTLENTKLS